MEKDEDEEKDGKEDGKEDEDEDAGCQRNFDAETM